jgi:hypothetical protein
MHGELSNQRSYNFAIRIEDFLTTRKLGLINRLKRDTYELNQDVLSLMNYIYRHTEYTVELVVDESNYSKELKDLLYHDNLPFNSILVINKQVEITNQILRGDISYYVDSDPKRRSLTNSPHALTLSECNSLVRGGSR